MQDVSRSSLFKTALVFEFDDKIPSMMSDILQFVRMCQQSMLRNGIRSDLTAKYKATESKNI